MQELSSGVLFRAWLVLIGCHAFGVYVIPEWAGEQYAFFRRIWGFHFWTFYPTWMAIAAYVIAMVSIWPPVQTWGYRKFQRFPSVVEWIGQHRYAVWCVLGGLSWIVFWVLRQKYGLLGDGYLRATDVQKGQIPTEEIGSMSILVALYRVLSVRWDDAVLAMQVFSVFWGGCYVFLVCLWCDRAGRTALEKLFVGVLLLLVGIVQYFFGYIEVYAPMPVFVLGFVICGHLVLEKRISIIWPTLLFILGTIMHVMMAAIAPALLYVWYVWAGRCWPHLKRLLWIAICACFALGITGYWVLSQMITIHVRWLPILANNEHPYAILTMAHLWEWGNAQILGAPMAWPLLVLCGFLWIEKRWQWDATSCFLALISAGYVIGSLALNFVLGSRDWDIWCFVGLPLTLLATWIGVRTAGDFLKAETQRYVLGSAVVLTTLNTLPWIWINHTDLSLDRTIASLEGDPAEYYRKHPADLVLGMLMSDLSETHAMKAYLQGFERYPDDARFAYNIAVLHYRAGRYESAIDYGKRALEIFPGYVASCRLLAFAYDELRDDRQALHYGTLYCELGGKDDEVIAMMSEIVNRLGQVAIQHQRIDQAIVLYRHLVNLSVADVDVYLKLASLYREQGAVDSTRSVLEKAYLFAPNDDSIVQALKKVSP